MDRQITGYETPPGKKETDLLVLQLLLKEKKTCMFSVSTYLWFIIGFALVTFMITTHWNEKSLIFFIFIG